MVLREVLKSSRVRDLAPKEVPVLDDDDSVSEAAAQMRAHSHGSAMVCRGSRLAGIFTERDLLKLVATGKSLDQPLSAVMTVGPKTVTVDDSLLTVIKLMDEGGYRRLPVVDASGAPVGIVDVKSVVHYLVEHFPKAVYNQAAQALLTARSREGA